MEFKVKFEDIKTGQILEDAHGNRFKVLDITYENEYYPVRLKCVEFKKSVKVNSHESFTNKSQTLCVLKDRSMLLSIDDGLGKYIKENFYSSLALGGSLQRVTLNASNGSKRNYILGRQSTIDDITFTLSDLKIVKDDCLTIDNIRMNMTISDGLGNIYTVSYYNGDRIQLNFKAKTVGANGESRCFDAYVWIPFESNDKLSAKDFHIVYEDI